MTDNTESLRAELLGLLETTTDDERLEVACLVLRGDANATADAGVGFEMTEALQPD